MGDFTFSLIMATYGRFEEVDKFLQSIRMSNYNIKKVQIIIVDQNEETNLRTIVEKHKDVLHIEHIQSNKKGLSYNRNIGLRLAKGDYIAFPDDDCEYFPETLSIIEDKFKKYKDYGLIIGRIVDKNLRNSIRNWPNYESEVNKLNFFTKYSSITIFFRREIFNTIHFCEDLGVGTKFGSCEDADITYKALKITKARYFPDIIVYHPHSTGISMSEKKIYNYGLGFGGFCKENIEWNILFLFFQVLGYHFIKMIYFFLRLDFKKCRNSYLAVLSRIQGFCQYERVAKRITNA